MYNKKDNPKRNNNKEKTLELDDIRKTHKCQNHF